MVRTSLVGRVVDPGADLQPMTFDDVRRGADGVIHTPDDVFLNPIAGAKVWVLGQEDRFVFTDAEGRFELLDVPTGNVKLAIDGRTATNAPTGVFWPEMVMDLTLEAGLTNTVMGSMGSGEEQRANEDRSEVYLPRLQRTMLQDISDLAGHRDHRRCRIGTATHRRRAGTTEAGRAARQHGRRTRQCG